MKIHRLTRQETLKAVGIGIVTALILSAVMVPAFKLGIAPFPKLPSLAFAELLFGANMPLPVGLLFHVVYVAFWALAYVVVWTIRKAQAFSQKDLTLYHGTVRKISVALQQDRPVHPVV